MKLDELKIKVPNLKPRNSTYQTLLAKKNAAGAHKDKKDALKRGDLKHKNKVFEGYSDDQAKMMHREHHMMLTDAGYHVYSGGPNGYMYKNSENHDVVIHKDGSSTFVHKRSGKKEDFKNLDQLKKHVAEVMARDNYEDR